jgi:hypothetical protein
LLGVALASNIALLVEAAAAPSSFDVVQYESRFSDISKDLPKDSVIGYLTDADPNLTSTSAGYYLAEYALAPVVVANNTDQKLVMANAHTPQPPQFYQSRGLELVRDYGNGVMLLRKAAR